MNKAHSGISFEYSRFFAVAIRLMAGLLLSACATVQPTYSSLPGARQYQDQLHLSGRITVRYQQNEKEQTLSGGFEWQHAGSETSITLLSPLGQTIVTINQSPSGASLQQANQPLRMADDIDSLLKETLGWPLPVAGLRDWLQGYARQPGNQRVAIAARDNQLLDTDGWQLRYVSWLEEDGLVHPKRIDLHRYTTQAGDVTMRIVIDQWKTP